MKVPEEATVDGRELSPGARDVLGTLGASRYSNIYWHEERVRNIEEALTWLADRVAQGEEALEADDHGDARRARGERRHLQRCLRHLLVRRILANLHLRLRYRMYKRGVRLANPKMLQTIRDLFKALSKYPGWGWIFFWTIVGPPALLATLNRGLSQ